MALNRALESLETAATMTSSTSESLALWGHALSVAGDLDRAADALRKATTRFPLSPTAFGELAIVEQERGNPQLAVQALAMQAALDGRFRHED